jgi:hypothetical protein
MNFLTNEEILILFIRTIGSLPVLVFPFLGSIFAILIDLSDLFMMDFLQLGGVSDYQKLDKFADVFYMTLFLIVSFRWNSYEKFISIYLFLFRIIGLVLFFLFNERFILVLFPNVFEFWFVLISGHKYFFNYIISRKTIIKLLFISIIFKLPHEIFIHYIKTLDKYTVTEFLQIFFK